MPDSSCLQKEQVCSLYYSFIGYCIKIRGDLIKADDFIA